MDEINRTIRDNIRKIGALQRRSRREHHMANFPSSQNRVLSILNLNDGLEQKQLAFILGVRPQSVGELLTKMESNGWVERKVSDEDSRKNLVYLTSEGRKKAQEIGAEDKAEIYNCLDDEEKKALNRLLEKVIANAPELDERELRMPPRFHGEMPMDRMPGRHGCGKDRRTFGRFLDEQPDGEKHHRI